MTRWASNNWQIPLIATPLYLVGIVVVRSVMADRQPIRMPLVVAGWNFGLSFFSIAGAAYCVPALLLGVYEDTGLLTQGFYPSVCMQATSWGCGPVGFFVFLFIMSKLAELLDTFWLLLRKSPVILLHWYHHASVLLYCWHSYSMRIGTGLWFASMNYTVHSIMYFYFGLTQCGPIGRRIAKKFSIAVTLLQLAQMIMGIVVTVASVVYHYHGESCYVSLANSIIAFIMYASYFVLFAKLFRDHYMVAKKPEGNTGKQPLPLSKAATGEVSDRVFEGWAETMKGGESTLAALIAAEKVAKAVTVSRE